MKALATGFFGVVSVFIYPYCHTFENVTYSTMTSHDNVTSPRLLTDKLIVVLGYLGNSLGSVRVGSSSERMIAGRFDSGLDH